MKKILGAFAFSITTSALAEPTLVKTMAAPWNTFIFVSTQMPAQSVIELAREASQAKAVIVLTGFGGSDATLTGTQRYAAQINAVCCAKQPARWIVDPVLTRRYRVTAAPTFVVAHGNSENPGEYSKVAGEMSLAQALKFFAQTSSLPSARDYSARTYYSAYGSKY